MHETVGKLDWETIWYLNPDKRHLIQTFIGISENAALHPFQSFANLWMAFNAFGSVATAFDSDWKIIQICGSDDQMRNGFKELLGNDDSFAIHVREFVGAWPIYSEREAFRVYRANQRRQGIDTNIPDEAEMRRLCANGSVERHPPDFSLSWANVLDAIYTVRCNLFHGGKTPVNERDVQLVELSRNILSRMMAKLELG